MKTKLILGLAVTCLITGNMAFAAVVLVDRGLPTAGLNDPVSLNRSNVAWVVDNGNPVNPLSYSVIGDSFTNSSLGTYNISSIRLWSIRPISTATLWGGLDGSSTFGVVSASGLIANTTYADSSTYQRSSGAFAVLNQIDFAVSITLAPGQTYDFFLDGTGGDYGIPFAHASNAALSVSPQQGSDNWMLQADVIAGSLGNVTTWTSDNNLHVTGDNNGGWDKASDINVQVFGTVPEGGSTLVLMGFALAGLGALRRRIRKN